MTSAANSPARSTKNEVDIPSPTPQTKAIPLVLERQAEAAPICSPLQTTFDTLQRIHPSSPSPEQETIDSLRQQCWLLDQVRIYGSIVRTQKAESARIKAETGTAPDPGIWECPFILSEFAVKERERVGLEVGEEREFLLRKRQELRGIVDRNEDAGASETRVESDAGRNDKLVIEMPLKRERHTAAKKVGQGTAIKRKRKRNVDDEAWPEWTDADDDEEYDPELATKSKSMAKPKARALNRAPELVAVCRANKNSGKTPPSGSLKQQMQTQVTKRLATKVSKRGKWEARG